MQHVITLGDCFLEILQAPVPTDMSSSQYMLVPRVKKKTFMTRQWYFLYADLLHISKK